MATDIISPRLTSIAIHRAGWVFSTQRRTYTFGRSEIIMKKLLFFLPIFIKFACDFGFEGMVRMVTT